MRTVTGIGGAIVTGILTGVTAGLAGCASDTPFATDTVEPAAVGSIANLHAHRGVLLASQPTPDDFRQAKEDGVVTVIDLRHEGETEFDERAVVEGLGLAYHNPAFGGPDELTDDVFDELRALLRTAPRPILLHCGSANRVGAVWMAYRVLDNGLDVETAAAEARTVGLRSAGYESKARDYIERRGDSSFRAFRGRPGSRARPSRSPRAPRRAAPCPRASS